MSTLCSPADAVPLLAQRWDAMMEYRFDLATLQNGTVLCNCPSLQAWREGDRERSIELFFSPEYLAFCKDFMLNTQQKAAAGISMVRVHLMDEERYERDADCRAYLDWLREHFRQINLRWGKEEVHWLPKSVCDEAGLVLPEDDTALYDGNRVVMSQYDNIGTPLSRVFYEVEEDSEVIERTRTLVAALTKIIADGSYKLTAATPAMAYPW